MEKEPGYSVDRVRAHDIVKVLGKHMCDEFDSGVSTDKVGQASICNLVMFMKPLKPSHLASR